LFRCYEAIEMFFDLWGRLVLTGRVVISISMQAHEVRASKDSLTQ